MKTLLAIMLLWTATTYASPVLANAHCYCQIAPWQSSPVAHPAGSVHNFGEIATYGSQNGHDNACQGLCLSRITEYFNGLGLLDQTVLCGGGARYGYYAVGNKAYRGAGELACPSVSAPKLWLKNQTPSGSLSSVQVGVNRSLLPAAGMLKVCIAKIGGPTIFQEICYTSASRNSVGSGTMTDATVTFNNVPRGMHYRVAIKRRASPLLGVFISIAQLEVAVL